MNRSLAFTFTCVVAMGCATGDDATTLKAPAANPAGFSADGGLVQPAADAHPIRTCDEAAAAHAYVGCEFWPTVVANNVWSIFDYAVVVANGGDESADILVTGNGATERATVAPGGVATIYLPWQQALKGPDTDACGRAKALDVSVFAERGAYRLTSSRPVTVHQFNALEFKGEGGPEGKDWSSCPGRSQACDATGDAIGCLSFSNDASLLLPQAALTGNYRVTGIHGWSHPDKDGATVHVNGSYVAITATRDATHVTVATRGTILAGKGINATVRGGTLTLTMNAGDVAELVGPPDVEEDLSGSLITADRPIQLIAGAPCIEVPLGSDSCDHLETSVLPAETWGNEYIVSVPTSANGEVVGHVVRLYGNRDGTHLVYAPLAPQGAPDVINAGEVIDLGVVSSDFRVTGDHELGVATFMLGGTLSDWVSHGRGDPSMSVLSATAQYRTQYVFLAPDDYDASYADIVAPTGAHVTLDDIELWDSHPIASTGFTVFRALLARGHQGAHHLTADRPVGLQVVGYGAYTSYQVLGGMDLRAIAPPPLK
ncbi:MAG: IgGFc-binding protein [Polyangiales bacterium]